MKNVKIIMLAAALISIISCKDKGTLPRDAYVQAPEGIIMTATPDLKSQPVTVIPFGEKIILLENADQTKSPASGETVKRYKTEWNGKTGWVHDSSIGTADSVIEQIKTSFAGQKSNFSQDVINAFESSPVKITDRYSYPGGEMEPAKIFFLSGGVMVLNSKIFTENYSNTFFIYEFSGEGKLLKIKFIDPKLNFNEYADMENNSRSVFKIDKNERTIIYHVNDNSFFFFNWGFHKE